MTDRITQVSPQLKARIAGGLYLIIIVAAGFAEIFVREALTVPGDAGATARNILASEALYRLGFVADLVNLVCDIGLALIFYELFKPVNRSLVLLAVFSVLVSIAISAVNLLNHFAPLVFLGNAHYLTAFEPNQLQALSLMALKFHETGFDISLVFFGLHCLLIGYVIFRSTFLPRILGALYAIAGLSYVINSFNNFLPRGYAAHLFPYIMVPAFVGEAALCLWLLVFGVNVANWQKQASAAGSFRT